MQRPSDTSTERALIAWVRSWLDLLGQGRLEEACELLDNDEWSPVRLIDVINLEFGPDTRFGRLHPEGPQFTPVETAAGNVQPSAGKLSDGTGYWVDHPMPLNGNYSDLFVQFEFYRHDDHTLSVVLHDVHVL